jgi:hypothetical protein
LSSPAIVKHLYRLGERSGITWFKHRFKQLVAGLDQIVDQEVRLNLIESRIDQLAASTEDADLHSITTSALNDIGNRERVREWLTWAESRRILVRGADIVCGRCGARRWRTMAELAPPVVCSSCGEVVEAPFDQTNLHFKYRASETLVRLTELDALGHVLALDWLAQLFQRQPQLCGGHPGVEFLRGGEVIGEADILLLFNDGACAVGEYKRSGSGLNETELTKLDNLADALDADWTFVATHEAAANCPAIWMGCQRTLPERPRLALSGDALYSQPIWLLGENPFSWANESGQPMRRVLDPAGNAGWFRRMAHPDSELFDSWEFMDRQPGPDGGESSN